MSNKCGRKGLPARIRFEVLQRDGFKCRYCGKVAAETELQVDHLVPFEKGGTDTDENLVTACSDCNRGKSNSVVPANRDETGKHPKANATSFRPGESGNPSGRPKLDEDQLAARRQAQAVLDHYTLEAAWTAVEMLQSFDPKARAAAFNSILDRSGMKGATRVELTGAGGDPLKVSNQVQHVIDPDRAVRILTILAAAGALPTGVAGPGGAGDPEDKPVPGAGADGTPDRVPVD